MQRCYTAAYFKTEKRDKKRERMWYSMQHHLSPVSTKEWCTVRPFIIKNFHCFKTTCFVVKYYDTIVDSTY